MKFYTLLLLSLLVSSSLMAQKDKYNKSHIDRLSRQVNDVRQENNELRDEIAHYDSEMRELRE